MLEYENIILVIECCHIHADQAQNPLLEKQTKRITGKEKALRMMILTQWIQALTQMLHVVAGT
jgi:cell division protein FtsL